MVYKLRLPVSQCVCWLGTDRGCDSERVLRLLSVSGFEFSLSVNKIKENKKKLSSRYR